MKFQLYKPIKGDLIDELFAKCINGYQCMVPVKRLGDGFYIFGSRKIYAKIMNGRLVIRVGGGFMVMEEFVSTYTDSELTKVNTLRERGTYDINNYDDDVSSPNSKFLII